VKRPPTKPTASDQEVIAALFWDLPALERGSAAAEAFLSLMGPGPWRQIDATVEGALGIAARGLYADRHGDEEQALRHYDLLARNRRYWSSLLGLYLTAWSDSSNQSNAFVAALDQVQLLDEGQTKARLLSKLASLALDRHRRDLFESVILEAAEAAAVGSLLHTALTYEIFNFGVSREFPRAPDVDPDPDPLVTLKWIDDLALRGARGSLEDAVVSRARNPWSWSFHFGRLPIHELIAAEEQARWAGALWKRQTLRRHAAGQLLLAGDGDQPLLLYGLKLWVTGGGKEIRNVIDLVEPQLTSVEGIDEIVQSLVDVPPVGEPFNSTLGEAALALWDLLPEEILVDLLDRIRPSAEFPSEIDIARRLWAVASLRVLPAVEARLPDLEAETKAVLLEHLSLTTLAEMTPQAALSFVKAAEKSSELSGGALGAAALLADRVGQNAAYFMTQVPASELAEAVGRFPNGASPRQVTEAERVLRSSLERMIADAARGRYAFGGRNPAADLGELATMTRRVTRATVKLLLRTACQERAPAHIRLEALLSLARLGHAGLLSDTDANTMKQASELGTKASFIEQEISTELLRAAKLLARSATMRLHGSEEIALLLLVRNHDPRVRQIAVNAASMAIASRPSQMLETSVLAALYDPDPETVVRAIIGIRNAKLESRGTLAAALQRFSTLMKESSREVRREVVHAAKAVSGRSTGANAKQAAQIVERALADRSWRVRREAVNHNKTPSDPQTSVREA
jgi:hypothetical protein